MPTASQTLAMVWADSSTKTPTASDPCRRDSSAMARAVSRDTLLAALGHRIIPMRLAPPEDASLASSGEVTPQTLMVFAVDEFAFMTACVVFRAGEALSTRPARRSVVGLRRMGPREREGHARRIGEGAQSISFFIL